MAKKRLTISPAASTPAKRKAERNLARGIKAAFKVTRTTVVPDLIEQYRKVMEEHRPAAEKLTKGINGEADEILNELDLTDWIALVDGTQDQLTAAGDDGAKRALGELKISDNGELFDQVHKEAVDFAKARAAELVGMRWNGRELVANPSAQWAITESTRNGIRDLVVSALTDGLTVKEFADKLGSSYLFSDARAETIARTEIARAHVEGTLEAWKASGVVEGKQWILGSEHDADVPDGDECDDNEDDGEIALDEAFSSGDDGPPAHPNCVCAIVTTIKETEAEPAEE